MEFAVGHDPREFDERAGPLLRSRVENNVLATILLALLDGRYSEHRPVFASVLDADGEVVAAALRTPPHRIVCSQLNPGLADQFIDAWLAEDPEPPGINAMPATARAIAAAWARRSGRTTRRRLQMALHSLQHVVDPERPASGRLLRASDEHYGLLVAWWRAFAEESGAAGTGAEEAVRARLDGNHVWLWQDRDEPVCLLATNPPVAGAVRIGPVYTPPERRRRGYGTTAVAALSRHELDAGARTCILFTDLANPTSNKIYADVGYRRISDWEEQEFVAG
jgi:uncharacterized protein